MPNVIWPQNVKDWLEAGLYLVGILAAVGSAVQYVRNSSRERIRWLFELYERFYDRSTLKEMRSKCAWSPGDFAKLKEDATLRGNLSEYLNFFELTAYMVNKGQISSKEVKVMFESPLKRLPQIDAVWTYICGRGYEQLAWLLKDLGYAKK